MSKTYVRPYRRKNQKTRGVHKVKGHTRNTKSREESIDELLRKSREHRKGSQRKDNREFIPKHPVISTKKLTDEQIGYLDGKDEFIKHEDQVNSYLIIDRQLLRYVEKESGEEMYVYSDSTVRSKVPSHIREKYETITDRKR